MTPSEVDWNAIGFLMGQGGQSSFAVVHRHAETLRYNLQSIAQVYSILGPLIRKELWSARQMQTKNQRV
jgi:hypothetical protein